MTWHIEWRELGRTGDGPMGYWIAKRDNCRGDNIQVEVDNEDCKDQALARLKARLAP